MQAKDISEEEFLAAVIECGKDRPARWANRYDVADALGLPEKLVLAKGRKLILRGILSGCPCGCRGDWVPLDKEGT